MTPADEQAAASRYKRVMAEVTAAATTLRKQDQERAKALGERLIWLDDQMLRTGERARLTASVVQLHWERALDLLWAEQWMQLRPRPEPDQRADPDRLDDYDSEVRLRSDELAAIVKRRWYEIRRR